MGKERDGDNRGFDPSTSGPSLPSKGATNEGPLGSGTTQLPQLAILDRQKPLDPDSMEYKKQLLLEKEERLRRFTANKAQRMKLIKLINHKLDGETRREAREYLYKAVEGAAHSSDSYKQVTTHILQLVAKAASK